MPGWKAQTRSRASFLGKLAIWLFLSGLILVDTGETALGRQVCLPGAGLSCGGGGDDLASGLNNAATILNILGSMQSSGGGGHSPRIPAGAMSCGGGEYCDAGTVCIGNHRCLSRSSDRFCSDGTLCPAGSRCGTNRRCIPEGAVDCGDGHYCSAGLKCGSGNRCMSRDAVDCGGGRSCAAGNLCDRNGGCLSASSERVCPNGRFCEAGNKCVSTSQGYKCIARDTIVCGDGTFCRAGNMCTRDHKCLSLQSARVCSDHKGYCDVGYHCGSDGHACVADISPGDKKARDAQREFGVNDPYAHTEGAFDRNGAAARGRHAADLAERQFASNDPYKSTDRGFVANRSGESDPCASDISGLGDKQGSAGHNCQQTSDKLPPSLSRLTNIDVNKLGRQAMQQCASASAANQQPCMAKAVATILLDKDARFSGACPGTTDAARIKCALTLMAKLFRAATPECDGAACIPAGPSTGIALPEGTVAATKTPQQDSGRIRGALAAAILADAEARAKAKHDRAAFLQDMLMLIEAARQFDPDSPQRAAIIASLKDQMPSHAKDIDEYFARLDDERWKNWKDPFKEAGATARERAEQDRLAERAASRPKLTPKQEEYCHLFADRVRRGDLGLPMARIPAGMFPPMCRAVVEDAAEDEAALQANQPAASDTPLDPGTQTAKDLFDKK